MEVATVQAPTWTTQFQVPGVELLDEKRERILSEIRDLEEALGSVDEEISLRRVKCDRLLAGQGLELVSAVAQTLSELGATVSRTDESSCSFGIWVHGDAERPDAVVHVAGGEGPVQRCDVRALVDVINEIWDRFGDPRCKGILIANAFCGSDPRERSEPAFPEELLGFCKQNEICLMTSLQLFNAYFAFANGELKDVHAFLDTLVKTTLEYPKFRNCSQAVKG